MAFLDMTNYISTLKYNYTVYNFHTLYELNTMLKSCVFLTYLQMVITHG